MPEPTPTPTPTPRPTLPPVELNIGPTAAVYDQGREEQIRDAIAKLRETMPALAAKIENLPWIEDGISGNELWPAESLIQLVDEGYSAYLIEEPWVIEGRNYPALKSLRALASQYPEVFRRIMSHPTIRDGITDQEAKILSTLITAADPVGFLLDDPDLLAKLLNPELVTLEERTITLPLAGETELTIIRTRPGADLTMDSLEYSVRGIEEFMGLPFPRRQVIYLFVQGPGGAIHLDTHVQIRADEQAINGETMLELLAHEASHYYWSGSPRWIVEGAATFMESVVKNTLKGPLDQPPCVLVRSIADLEGLDPDSSSDRRDCYYSLGERLFRDLYRNMDDITFRQAFRRLYLHAMFDVPNRCDNYAMTICHVREAFTTYAHEEMVATVEKVIDRWHDGTEPYDVSWIHSTPVEADISAIDGRIEGAYMSLSRDGPPVSAITLEPNRTSIIYMNLDYSYRPSSGLDYLPIEIALSYEDGFEFLRWQTGMPVSIVGTRRTHQVGINYERALGRYWVHAYLGEQKIAEASFETIPAPDPYSIRGVVTGPEGRPQGRIALEAKRGEEEFWGEAGLDGTFDVVVSSGTFFLEVNVPVRLPDGGTEWQFAGWYDGSGGITIDPSKAFEVIVDGADVEGINITLPSVLPFVADANIRGMFSGPDGRQLTGTALNIKGGGETFWIETRPDGTFNIGVPSGSYILEVKVMVADTSHFVGWYDGNGSITTDPSHAFEVIVDDTNVHDIAIMLPSATEELLCPSGYFRSTRTGRCTEI